MAQLHATGGGGTGGSDGGVRMAGGGSGMPEHLAVLQAAHAAKLAEVQGLRVEAAAEPGYAALDAGRGGVTLARLQGVLGAQERVLLLVPHGEGDNAAAHGLLIAPKGEVVHVPLPDLPAMVAESARFERGLIGRGGVRRAFDAALPEVETTDGAIDATPDGSTVAPAATPLPNNAKLIVCASGPLHDLSLEPGRPEGLRMSRMPGLASLALARGLYGGTPAQPELQAKAGPDGNDTTAPASRVAILADAAATDIPLAGAEGRAVAALWALTAPAADVAHPTTWPGPEAGTADLLHVAGHGDLRAGLAGAWRSVLVQAGRDIGEREVLAAPLAQEALLNVCVGGRAHDSALDGDVLGVVSGFLRAGTRWVAASLPPLPDDWALLAGLLVTEAKAQGLALPEALEQARHRLVHGGWSDAVSEAYADALARTTTAPGSHLIGTILGVLAPKGSATARAMDVLRIGGAPWWLGRRNTDARPLADLPAPTPDDIARWIRDTVSAAIRHAQQRGTPNTPTRDTVRYGMTTFGQ